MAKAEEEESSPGDDFARDEAALAAGLKAEPDSRAAQRNDITIGQGGLLHGFTIEQNGSGWLARDEKSFACLQQELGVIIPDTVVSKL